MGGGGDSSSANTTQTTTQNTDKRQVVDGNSVGVSSDSSTVNVTSTDHAAVAAAFDLAKVSSAQTADTISKALQFASDNLKLASASAAGVGDAYKTANNLSSGQTYLIAGVLAVAGIVAIKSFGKAS